MNHRIHPFLFALALLAAGMGSGVAAIEGPPSTIDYQGTVYNSDGKPYGSNGTGTTADPYTKNPVNYAMQFRIYDALSGGNLIWEERQIVTVTLGRFSVRLGNGSAIGPKHGDLKTVFDGKERFIGLTVEAGTAPYGEISPRLAFLSAPFAFNANYAVTAGVASRAVLADGVTQLTGTSTFDNLSLKTATAATLVKAPTLEATAEVKAPIFTGSGAHLTNLEASQVVGSGTLPDGVLSANIPRKNTVNVFTSANTFSGDGNSFKGDGAGLTNLNPDNFSKPVPASKISDDVVKFALNDKPLFVRSTNDFHGLVFGNSDTAVTARFGTNTFNGTPRTMFGVDGPVLYGFGGGSLGTFSYDSQFRTQKVLSWARDEVLVSQDLKFNKNNGMQTTWTFAQTPEFGGANKGEEMRLSCSSTSSAWFYFQANGQSRWSSDLRLKKDITALPPVLDSVLKLRPVKYRLKERPETESKVVGFIAQDVLPLFPETVGKSGEYYSLSYSDFGVYAVGAIQELTAETRRKSAAADAEIKRLQTENRALRQSLSDLERRLTALEASR